jgi:hypothetical protein
MFSVESRILPLQHSVAGAASFFSSAEQESEPYRVASRTDRPTLMRNMNCEKWACTKELCLLNLFTFYY